MDGVVSASYTELTTRPNLNPNQKVKTLITVRKMTKDEMGGDYFPDDEGESYKILEIKTGIVTEVPRAALTPAGQPAKKDNDVQAVAEVKGPGGVPAKRPVGAGGNTNSFFSLSSLITKLFTRILQNFIGDFFSIIRHKRTRFLIWAWVCI